MQTQSSPQREPCGHSVVTHRHGIADARRTEDLDRLRHFRKCARTPAKAKRIRKIIEKVKDERRQSTWPTRESVCGTRCAQHLDRIAACESGGNPRAVNPAGYYGKYQFDYGTWASVGGSGNPAKASEAEQDYRAAKLYAARGSDPWPVCQYE